MTSSSPVETVSRRTRRLARSGRAILKSVRHVGLRQRRGARLHPAVEERLVVRGGLALAVSPPMPRPALSWRLSSALLCASCSSVHWPASLSAFTAPGWTGTTQFMVCRSARKAARAGRGVLVGVVACDHRLGDGVDQVGRLRRIGHEDRIGVVAELDRLVLGDAGAAGRDVREEERADLLHPLPAGLVAVRAAAARRCRAARSRLPWPGR